jgi:hypothetical protein
MISRCVCCVDRIRFSEIDIGDRGEVDSGLSDLTMGVNDDESESSFETQLSTSVTPGGEMGVEAFTAMLERMQQEDPAALQLLLASRGIGKRPAKQLTILTNPKKRLEEVKNKKTKLC